MPRRFTASAWSQFLATACLLTLLAHAADAGTPAGKRLFVLQKASGAMIEYDLKTGTPVSSVPVPPETFKQDHPILTPKVSPADDSDGWAYPRALLSADGGNPFWYKTKRGDKWTGQKRAEASEHILDAKRRGEIMVEAVPDAGCCGWANDSSDMTIVRRSGSRITIF